MAAKNKLNLRNFNIVSNSLEMPLFTGKLLHTRDTRGSGSNLKLKYCNIIKKVSNKKIKCHIGGSQFDIRYDIEINNGMPEHTLIRYPSHKKTDAIDIVDREFHRIFRRIQDTIANSHIDPPNNYKAGNYYIQRNIAQQPITNAHKDALANSVFPSDFGQNIVSWGFKIIEGHG